MSAHDLPDLELARFNMIEQQIRPWQVLDQTILDLLFTVPREQYVAAAYKSLAFVDQELPLEVNGQVTGECMLAPKVEARVLQELTIKPTDEVLEIGTGSGYMAALLAHLAHSVNTVEIHPELKKFAESNLQKNGIRNAQVFLGNGISDLAPSNSTQSNPTWADKTYDVIVISGGLTYIPPFILDKLAPHGRLSAFVGSAPIMSAQLLQQTRSDSVSRNEAKHQNNIKTINLFETYVPPLREVLQPSQFRF